MSVETGTKQSIKDVYWEWRHNRNQRRLHLPDNNWAISRKRLMEISVRTNSPDIFEDIYNQITQERSLREARGVAESVLRAMWDSGYAYSENGERFSPNIQLKDETPIQYTLEYFYKSFLSSKDQKAILAGYELIDTYLGPDMAKVISFGIYTELIESGWDPVGEDGHFINPGGPMINSTDI